MKKKNVIIGATAVVSILLLLWGIEFLKGINLFKPANFYYCSFEKVDGLNISAPVTVNGFQVGQVRDISYDYEHNKITVELSMDKKMRIPVGSTITLTNSLLGNNELALTLSHNPDYYKVGDYITATTQVGLMDKVGSDVMPQVNVMLPKVDSILGNVNALTANPALAQSVSRLNLITEQLAQSSIELNALLAQLRKQVPTVVSNVNGVVTHADGVVGQVNGMASDLQATSANLNKLSYSLSNLPLDSTINRVNATLANVQKISDQLNNKNSSLGLLLNDTKLYDNANASVNNLQLLLEDIKKNPKRYVTIKVF